MHENSYLTSTRKLARAGLTLLACSGLALALLASEQATTTLAQPGATATSTTTPEPTAIPSCPSDRVDRNHDGQDNGDCVPVTAIRLATVPADCASVPGYFERYGRVACQPQWAINGVLASMPIAPLLVNQGCVDVRRKPYPRLMVGLGTPTLTYEGAIPTHDSTTNPAGWMTGYGAGWYQTGLSGLALTDLPSGGTYAAGNWMGQAFGGSYTGGDFPPVRLHDAAADFYPSLNNIAMRLVFVLRPSAETPLKVSIDGSSGSSGPVSWSTLQPLRFSVNRSSNPNAAIGSDDVVPSGGPTRSGPASLPSFKLRVESVWDLYVQVRAEIWIISNGVYQFSGTLEDVRAAPVPGYQDRIGYRVWDSQQGTSAGLLGTPNCNNDDNGYVPVPVLEGQSILVH